MEFFPSMSVFLSIGDNIEIRWYAVCILVGALLTYLLGTIEIKKAGYKSDTMDDLFIGALFFGVIGARIWYVVFYNLTGYLADWTSIFSLWDGGLSIQGGLIGGALFVWWYTQKHNLSFLHVGDIILPNVLIAQAVGIWGCYFNQNNYGKIVDSTFFNGILNFIKKGMYIDNAYRMPIFFYESVLCLLGWILIKIYRKTKHSRGGGIFTYLAWYGLVRFWIEVFRNDALSFESLNFAQYVSIVFLLIGVLGVQGVFNKLIYKEKPCIIFDLDGTLLDTQKAIYMSFEYVFKKFAPELELTDEDYASFLGPTLEQSFRKYCPQGNVGEMIDCYRQYNAQIHKDVVKPVQHVPELLAWLKENDYKMAIGSSKKASTIRLGLDVTGLQDYFDVIVGVEDVTNPKPDKETILKALDLLGCRKDCCIYVGDSSSDILCAKNAGVYSIAITTNKLFEEKLRATNPNVVIDDMLQIKDVLEQNNHSWTSDLN